MDVKDLRPVGGVPSGPKAASRDGVRQHLGHALMALGRAIHGIDAENAARSALDAG